jgi:hypothetical protein
MRRELRELARKLRAGEFRMVEPKPPTIAHAPRLTDHPYAVGGRQVYPLRPGMDIVVEGLPDDLSPRDVARIAVWLDVLRVEYDEHKPTIVVQRYGDAAVDCPVIAGLGAQPLGDGDAGNGR